MMPSAGGRVLRVGSLIDGASSVPVIDAGIRIEGSAISWVGPWAAVPPPGPSDEVVDLRPYVAVPGFIDVHTHMTLFADGRSYEDMAAEPDELMLLVAARNARTHLENGVTTARDNGSRNRLGLVLRDAIDRGFIPGPRMLVSARPITPPGGHFFWCNGEAEGSYGVTDAVKELVGEGVDHIKIMASGGGTRGTDPRRACYSVEELRAAVLAAHDHDRLTTAHCRALESMERAIDAGLDCMEHAEFLRTDGRLAFDEATAARLAASDMYVSPTLQACGWDTIVRLKEAEGDRELSTEERTTLDLAEDEMRSAVDNFGRMLELGLGPRIVGGTDAGCFDFSFGHMDACMLLMERGGMTRMQAIWACTSVAADAIGLGGSTGVLARGLAADLVILGSDPIAGLRAIADVRAVFKQGVPVVSRIAELVAETEPSILAPLPPELFHGSWIDRRQAQA
jgi:imidazolonepropionase-like amidohydrolase